MRVAPRQRDPDTKGFDLSYGLKIGYRSTYTGQVATVPHNSCPKIQQVLQVAHGSYSVEEKPH